MIVFTLVIVSLYLAIIELPVTGLYGWFISKEHSQFWMNINPEIVVRNSIKGVFRQTIMYPSLGNMRNYVSIHISVFSKYHIHGYGRVLRWSKLHFHLNEVNEYVRVRNISRQYHELTMLRSNELFRLIRGTSTPSKTNKFKFGK